MGCGVGRRRRCRLRRRGRGRRSRSRREGVGGRETFYEDFVEEGSAIGVVCLSADTAILERVGCSGDDVGVCERLLPMPLPKHESAFVGPIGLIILSYSFSSPTNLTTARD